MLKEAADGFSMAMADSVPGVSGGTVAFIMGFYDRFIGSIHDLVFRRGRIRREGLTYLLKLGVGWVIGMGLAVLVLNSMFELHIHFISSLFIGFIIGALPVVIMDEPAALKEWKKGIVFLPVGAALVAGITYLSTQGGAPAIDLTQFTPLLAIRLFFIGMIAICAMFLPGISGSTMLLIFGAYMPIMTALKGLMQMDFTPLPAIIVFIFGILAGAASVVRLIQLGLEKFRPQMMYFILGMMIASLYAVVMGPVTLKVPQLPLSLSNFSIPACLIGAAIVIGMQAVRMAAEGRNKAAA